MIAIIGEHGFFGTGLCEYFSRHEISYVGINRSNYEAYSVNSNFDVVINCAMPSARFAAKNNPMGDFNETVLKTARIKYDFPNAKVIQISSISAAVQLDTVYGRHKRAAEQLLDEHDLIIRLGPLYDQRLTKGALIDILNNKPVYVSGDTRYGFTPLSWVYSYLKRNLDQVGLIELGAKGYVMLQDLANTLGSKSEFSGARDDQVFSGLLHDQPHANEVIAFCQKYMESQKK
jgi:hypothetical protein